MAKGGGEVRSVNIDGVSYALQCNGMAVEASTRRFVSDVFIHSNRQVVGISSQLFFTAENIASQSISNIQVFRSKYTQML